MPTLQRAFALHGGQLSLLGVDTEDDSDSARDFLAATGVHYPQVVDGDGKLLRRVGGSGLPITIVLDGKGRQVFSHRGQLADQDLAKALTKAGVPAR